MNDDDGDIFDTANAWLEFGDSGTYWNDVDEPELLNELEIAASIDQEDHTENETLETNSYNNEYDNDLQQEEDQNQMDLWVYEAINFEQYLQTIFPNYVFSVNVIYESLFMTNNNYELATNIIAMSIELLENCKPCRHMLTSKCLRKDCQYDHNVSHIPCRYWLTHVGCDNLKQGKFCPFLHQLPSSYDHSYMYQPYLSNEGHNSDPSPPPPNVNEIDEFPALAPTTTKTNNNNNNNNKPTKDTTETTTKLTDSQRIYQSIFTITKTNPTNNSGTSTGKSSAASAAAVTRKKVIRLKDAMNLNWVDSGRSVGEQYTMLRKDARIHAIARNKLLVSATKAYLR